MAVHPIQDALGGCEVERDERKDARERRGVELAMHKELVVSERRGAPKSLLLLEECRFQDDQLAFKEGFDLVLHFIDLLLGRAVDRKIDPHIEELFLRL